MAEPDYISVFTNADENYIKPMATMMASLLINHKRGLPIKFFFSGQGISSASKNSIENLAASYAAEVEWYEVDTSDAENFRKCTAQIKSVVKHLPVHVFYRLMMPHILPENISRVIYLDCDLLVLGDIEELWHLPLGDNGVLATQEFIIPTISDPYVIHIFEDLGLKPDTKYFNAGVMMANMDYWRQYELVGHFMDFLTNNAEKLLLWDQDVLNAVLANQWGELPPYWNQETHLHEAASWQESPFSEDVFNAALEHPNIIHFCTKRKKPWNPGCKHPATDLYFEYLDKTPWKGWRPAVCDTGDN